MQYQKKFSRKKAGQRMILLLIITAVLFTLLGVTLGRLGFKTKAELKQKKSDVQYTVYGVYDDRQFDNEVSLDWDKNQYDFKTLECGLDAEVQEFLFYLCKGYNIDFSLMMGLIQEESNFDSNMISQTNDYGLMQINKVNHQWITEKIGINDFLDPYQNIRAGCYVIRKLFEKYKDPEMVLMAYHFGEHGASTLWNQGVYSSKYSQTILKYQKTYTEQIGSD